MVYLIVFNVVVYYYDNFNVCLQLLGFINLVFVYGLFVVFALIYVCLRFALPFIWLFCVLICFNVCFLWVIMQVLVLVVGLLGLL